jgi:phage regulator Rha-like protein
MSNLSVSDLGNGILVVDSRLIAEGLGIEHESFMKTIRKYQTQAEQSFGALRFQIGARSDGNKGGEQPEYVFLTEEQATFYMTLSRNTPEVVQLKADLVRKFSSAKQLLRQQGIQQQYTTIYIQRLENMADHDVPYDSWTTFREGAEILLIVEKQYKIPVDQMDLCDGSIGTHWRNYRISQSINNAVGEYVHRFRDRRGERACNAYQYNEIPVFKRWLQEVYIPIHLPKYLVDKYGKRAVRQIYEEQNKLTDYILEITEEKRLSPKQEEMYQIFLAAREAITNRYLLE